ncbi:MAG: flavodoxin domain-containing protein, partial [Muribaculaceae bacterium]|nr:flavodoxin domain-containing protein [Muribaculaceae bacterium]
MKLNTIFFSATDTTRKSVEALAEAMDMPVGVAVNLADRNAVLPEPGEEDVMIIAVPVYGGRIPTLAADKLKRLRGTGAKT